jgi:ligand-binding sensor domain-containing protein
MIIDSEGIFWIGHNEGLNRFNGKEFINVTVPKPQVETNSTVYSPDRITGIVEDQDGNIWLGTDGYGICRYDGQSFTHFTTSDGLADNAIHELFLDANGLLWIGTYWGGLSRWDGEKFTNFTQDGIISGVEVSAFFEDKNGDIWFGVENNGVYKYDREGFTHYDQASFLGGSILSIYQDRENRFWFGGWGGLFRYNHHNFTPVTENGPWK